MTYLRAQWDRVAAVVLTVLGAAALVLGWLGTRGTAYPAEQLPYIISGGLGSVLLVGTGAVLWLSADLRDEWRKLDELEQHLREPAASDAAASPPAAERLARVPRQKLAERVS